MNNLHVAGDKYFMPLGTEALHKCLSVLKACLSSNPHLGGGGGECVQPRLGENTFLIRTASTQGAWNGV